MPSVPSAVGSPVSSGSSCSGHSPVFTAEMAMSSMFQPQYRTLSSVAPMVQRIWTASWSSAQADRSTVMGTHAPSSMGRL